MIESISNYFNPTPLLPPTQKTPQVRYVFIIQLETDFRRKRTPRRGELLNHITANVTIPGFHNFKFSFETASPEHNPGQSERSECKRTSPRDRRDNKCPPRIVPLKPRTESRGS